MEMYFEGLDVKRLYLLLYSIALRSVSHSPQQFVLVRDRKKLKYGTLLIRYSEFVLVRDREN